MIYFLQSGDWNGPVKIGYTADLKTLAERVATLQTGNPEQLRVIGLCEGDREIEGFIHGHAPAEHRIRGEWFTPEFGRAACHADMAPAWGMKFLELFELVGDIDIPDDAALGETGDRIRRRLDYLLELAREVDWEEVDSHRVHVVRGANGETGIDLVRAEREGRVWGRDE